MPRPSVRPRSHLSLAEQSTVGTLSAQKVSERKIAEVMGRSRVAVRAALKSEAGQSAREAAKAILEAAAPEFAQDWVIASHVGAAQGNHKPARDGLVALRVVAPPAAVPPPPPLQIQIMRLPSLTTDDTAEPLTLSMPRLPAHAEDDSQDDDADDEDA